MRRLSVMMRSVLVLAGLGLAMSSAGAEDKLRLAIGQRGNWETAASELGQNAGFFKKRGYEDEAELTRNTRLVPAFALKNWISLTVSRASP